MLYILKHQKLSFLNEFRKTEMLIAEVPSNKKCNVEFFHIDSHIFALFHHFVKSYLEILILIFFNEKLAISTNKNVQHK